MATKIMRGLRKGTAAAKNPITDLSAYPILTEEVGYPPSPLAKPQAERAVAPAHLRWAKR
ncbi:MAG: hypothetical protein ABSE51_18800 [Terracidiphilus sp.]|jgi:hypothetical protein